MAKTRAQRKAERRKREERAAREAERSRDSDSRAQRRTQVPETAFEMEAELAEEGADLEQLTGSPTDRSPAEAPAAEPAEEAPQQRRSPAPSRADVGAPADGAPDKVSRRQRRRTERERQRRAKESQKRRRAPAEPQERQRGVVIGFLLSCWAELKRVQWPDRETLIQASAVTVLFIAVAAAYLGALDAVFNWLIKQIL